MHDCFLRVFSESALYETGLLIHKGLLDAAVAGFKSAPRTCNQQRACFSCVVSCAPSPHCRSYYAIVSLSVLPAAAYPPLFERAAQLPKVLAGPLPALPRPGWVLSHVSALQLAGAALFLAGNALQWHSHWLLARLGGKAKGRGPTYKIPRGAQEEGHGAGSVQHVGPAVAAANARVPT